MTFADLVSICLGVSAIVGLAILLWRLGWSVIKAIVVAVRRVGRVIDDLLGEDARPELPDEQRRRGVIELVRRMGPTLEEQGRQLAEQRALIERLTLRVSAVEAQLKPNGGSSLRDAVDKVRDAVVPTAVPQPRVEAGGLATTERAELVPAEELV